MDGQREPVESISAVTLLTVDMVAAVSFYQALGFHVLYGGKEGSFATFRVGVGYLNLQLDTAGSPQRTVWGRVVVWVDDVDAVHRHCVEQGLEITWPPTDEPWGVREMHVRHPDGHVFRISRGTGETAEAHEQGFEPE